MLVVGVLLTQPIRAQQVVKASELDSLRDVTKKGNGAFHVEARRHLGYYYARAGQYDSAAHYFKANYHVGQTKELEFRLNADFVLDYAKVLKRMGYYSTSIQVLNDLPDDKIDQSQIQVRIERALLMSNCCLNTGQLMRAHDNWKLANTLLKKAHLPNLEAQLHYQRGLILGVTDYSAELVGNFEKAVALSDKSNTSASRLDHLLCLASCRLYGLKPTERDSLIKLACQLIAASTDHSGMVDKLELDYRLYFHERNIPKANLAALEMWKSARRHKLLFLEGLADMYRSRNNETPEWKRVELLDSAIKIFRTCGQQNCLREALHERLGFSKPQVDKNAFALNHYEEYVSIAENWEEERAKVTVAFVQTDLLDTKQTLTDEKTNQGRLWAVIVVLGLIGSTGIALFLKERMVNQKLRNKVLAQDAELELIREEAETLQLAIEAHQTQSSDIETIEKSQSELELAIADIKTIIQAREQILDEVEQSLKATTNWSDQQDKLAAKIEIEFDTEGQSLIKLLSIFERDRPDFNVKLLKKAPDLTQLEQRICALVVLDLNNTTIAKMLNITEASFLNRRSIIRKKLGLDRKKDLQTYLKKF